MDLPLNVGLAEAAPKGCGCIGKDAVNSGGGHAEVDVGDALMGFDFQFDVELHGTFIARSELWVLFGCKDSVKGMATVATINVEIFV
jgi:hypothetical protein